MHDRRDCVPDMRDASHSSYWCRTQAKAERASVLIRHTRQRVRRLNAVMSRVHSALTLAMPRSLNCCASSWFLMIAKRGSTSGNAGVHTIAWPHRFAIHSLCPSHRDVV